MTPEDTELALTANGAIPYVMSGMLEKLNTGAAEVTAKLIEVLAAV